MNYWYIIYLGQVLPFKAKAQNRLEIFNEWIIQILCFHLFCFTDFIDLTHDDMIQYKIGHSFIIITLMMIAINVSNMVYNFYRPISLWNMKRKWVAYKIWESNQLEELVQREKEQQKSEKL